MSAAAASASSSASSAVDGPTFGLTLLDRASFTERVPCVALSVPNKSTSIVLKALPSAVLRVPKIRPVNPDPHADPAGSCRLILLGPHVTCAAGTTELSGLEPAETVALQSLLAAGTARVVAPETTAEDDDTDTNAAAPSSSSSCSSTAAAAAAAATTTTAAATTGNGNGAAYVKTYAMLNANQVFRRLLPASVGEFPASFETAGHVAHLNLRPACLPYKRLIGQVLLDKNKHIRTVVNKTSHIATQFRTFPMELLAGEDNTRVEVRESGARFRLDFREVYWNSRLQMEHKRIVAGFAPTDVVCDMMAGIGPFAVPAAMKGCTVYANDLNPASYKYLLENVRLNKVAGRVHASNLDARGLVTKLAAERVQYDRVLMNLPASAIEFLDVFCGAFRRDWWDTSARPLPVVHCHCFSSADDRVADVLQRVAAAMRCNVTDLGTDARVQQVRDVSPRKFMMCAEFRVPECVAFATAKRAVDPAAGAGAAASAKRQRRE